MHLLALHQNASNNPEGFASTSDRIRFHPYYTSKDLITIFLMIILLSLFVFFYPNYLGQMMAVQLSNFLNYYSTICWNITHEIISTHNISEKILIPFIVKMKFFQLQSARNKSFLFFRFSSSETTRTTPLFNDQFSYWFAGLIDGDGSLLISKQNHPSIEITLDSKDYPTLYYIKHKLNCGNILKRSNSNSYRIRFTNKNSILKILYIINGKLLTDSKHIQLIKFCKLFNIKPIMNFSYSQLSTNILFLKNNAWLSGFFDAEGFFYIRNKYT